MLLTCSYKSQEFIRVGYYVNNEYADPDMKENPPSVPDFEQVCGVFIICRLYKIVWFSTISGRVRFG